MNNSKNLKIYYAHHILKYYTPIENYEKNIIKHEFDCNVHTLINPSDIEFFTNSENEIMKKCLQYVSESDIIVFSTYSGIVGKGVYQEINHAIELNKEIFVIEGDKLIICENRKIKWKLTNNNNKFYAVLEQYR